MRRGRLLLILGFLIAIGGALALLFFLQTPTTPQPVAGPPTAVPFKKVVAARIDIPNNTVITDTETFLTLQDIPEPDYNAAPNTYFTSIGEVTNKLTLRQILATEILRADMLTAPGLSQQIPPPDTPEDARPKAYPVQVDNLTGVADQITQGDFVDLIMTFEVQRTIVRPSMTTDPATGLPTVTFIEEPFTGRSTKTLVQNAQVLQIVKPAPTEGEGTPTPEGQQGPPQTGPDGQPLAPNDNAGSGNITPGTWTLVLAITDQEAEIVEFARNSSVPITLVLRGRGDTAVEDTAGATFDILVRQFGLPMPEPAPPAPLPIDALTPQPTPSNP